MQKIETNLQRLAGLIKDLKFTMLSTVDKSGAIYSRPMANQKIDTSNFDGKLWFFTRKDSPKVHELENDQHVNLAYANPDKQQYVSVSGKASLSDDRSKMEELWSPELKAWFPEGLEDPQIYLICVNIISAELWDSPLSKVVQVVGMVKSMISGEPIDKNMNSEIINLQH